MKRDFEAIVLGLGGIGSGALYWLSRRLGREVLGIEQFDLGHRRGGSQDHSRIIRYSYHTAAYVRLAARAYDAWAEVEAEGRERLILKCGGLDLFPPGGAIPMTDYTESLDACKVPYELLDDGEIGRRWPHFRVPQDTVGLFQQEGGLVRADQANAAHRRLARERGAELRERATVTAVRQVAGEYEVVAGGTPYRAERLVIAAGAWSNTALALFGLELPLTVTQEQVHYFSSPRRREFSANRFPIWIWMDEPSFYGFPDVDGVGVKVAQDVGGREVTAETRTFEPDPENTARVEGFCARHLPGALGPIDTISTCLYTMPPDRDFVVDSVPGYEGAYVAIGAGHAFKFASALGRVLAELVVDGGTEAEIDAFRIDRPILAEKDPVRSFVI